MFNKIKLGGYSRIFTAVLLCLCVYFCISTVYADPLTGLAGLTASGVFPFAPPGMSGYNFSDPLDLPDMTGNDLEITITKTARVDETGTWAKVEVTGSDVSSFASGLDTWIGSFGIVDNYQGIFEQYGVKWLGVYFFEQSPYTHPYSNFDYVFYLPHVDTAYRYYIGDLSYEGFQYTTTKFGIYLYAPNGNRSWDQAYDNSLKNTVVPFLGYVSGAQSRVQLCTSKPTAGYYYPGPNSAIAPETGTYTTGYESTTVNVPDNPTKLSFYIKDEHIPQNVTLEDAQAKAYLDELGKVPVEDVDGGEWDDTPPAPVPTPVPTDTIGGAPVADLWDHFDSVLDDIETNTNTTQNGFTAIGGALSNIIQKLLSLIGIGENNNDIISDGFTDVDEDLNDLLDLNQDQKDTLDIIPPMISDIHDSIDDINVTSGDIKDTLDDISTTASDSKTLLQRIKEALEDITSSIEQAGIGILSTGLDLIPTVFGAILGRLKGFLGIWHYVVEWLQSISAPFAFFRSCANSISYNLILPIYACIAGGIVIAVYRRFGK